MCAWAALSAGCGARTDLGERTDETDVVIPFEKCGNGIVSGDEECDDANAVDTDACLSTCVLARCGDGVLATFEACDDGNTIDSDGCTNACTKPTCGDGIVQAGEECDSPNPSVCTPLCRVPTCGDGFLRPDFEECDAGMANSDRPALALLDGKTIQPIKPVVRNTTATAFYGYGSASAHTGFEAVTRSNLFLYGSSLSSGLSLFTIHGIDKNSSGLSDGKCEVQQTFSGLPPGTSVVLTDDDPKEFQLGATGTAIGDWGYEDNTDGGVLTGLPFPGNWSVRVDSAFIQGVDEWVYVDGDGAPLPLDASFAILEANADPSPCRTDCTLPRCGDGIVDPGETCDDGNFTSGDGCSSDCTAFD